MRSYYFACIVILGSIQFPLAEAQTKLFGVPDTAAKLDVTPGSALTDTLESQFECDFKQTNTPGQEPAVRLPESLRNMQPRVLKVTLEREDVLRFYIRRADNRLVFRKRQGHVMPAPGDEYNWQPVGSNPDVFPRFNGDERWDHNPLLNLVCEPKLPPGNHTLWLWFIDTGVSYHYQGEIYLNGLAPAAPNFPYPAEFFKWNYFGSTAHPESQFIQILHVTRK